MKVGDSVRKAIADWEAGDHESAMMHACNAVDGTAKKVRPPSEGNKKRFTGLLRDHFGILGPFGAPGIDLVRTRFPVDLKGPTAPGGQPDFADVIYGIHRCTHAHGDALPGGFELIRDVAGPRRFTQMHVEAGKVRMSDRVIFGLLAVAVLVSPDHQEVPDGFHLAFGQTIMPINEWWGRAADFAVLAAAEPLPLVKLDFGDWMPPRS